MGGGQSTNARKGPKAKAPAAAPKPPAPKKVIFDAFPQGIGAAGISLSQAVKCNECNFEVDTNISSSTVKLVRELGDITFSQCNSYNVDFERVKNGTLGLQEFLVNIRAGSYARETTVRDGVTYCQMLSIGDENAASIKSLSDIEAKLDKGRIRKLRSLGSFSSETKARFIPSIPFKMKFKAIQKYADGVSSTVENEVSVTQMTLYYPSPIRIDSVQADAMLSLNDPSDSDAKAVILIPLRGTSGGGGATEFMNRIAGHLATVNQYDRVTGTYPSVSIPTGADWSLGKLFTVGTSASGGAVVKNGFFTWSGSLLGRDIETYIQSETPYEIRYGWRPRQGVVGTQYFMLDSPLAIDSVDLATITRNLPPTEPMEAVPPIGSGTIFHKDAVPPAPDTISGRTGGCGIGNLCEGYANIGVVKEPFEGCPGAKCDPFLQNAKRIDENKFFSPEFMFGFLFNFLVAIAMFVGAYIAMMLIGEDFELQLRDFSELTGKVGAVWAKSMTTKPSVQ